MTGLAKASRTLLESEMMENFDSGRSRVRRTALYIAQASAVKTEARAGSLNIRHFLCCGE